MKIESVATWAIDRSNDLRMRSDNSQYQCPEADCPMMFNPTGYPSLGALRIDASVHLMVAHADAAQ